MNYQNRGINIEEKMINMQSASMGTEFQSGSALIKYKFAESVANSIHRGGYAGYNLLSMYKVNPLLDLGGDLIGANKIFDKMASKIMVGNSNLTQGWNLTNNIGLRWITGDTISKAAAGSAEQNLMKGLNITFGPNGSATNAFGAMNEKFFKNALKNPLSNSAKFQALKSGGSKIISNNITKKAMGLAAKGLSIASTYMLYETAFDFAEMYNEHLMQQNIDKALNYNSNLFNSLQTESTVNEKNYNLNKMYNSEKELNYILSSVNTAEKYLGG